MKWQFKQAKDVRLTQIADLIALIIKIDVSQVWLKEFYND